MALPVFPDVQTLSWSGRLGVYVSLTVCCFTTFIGPIYFGMSFLALPLGMDRFFVDRYTRSPISNLGTMPFLLFA